MPVRKTIALACVAAVALHAALLMLGRGSFPHRYGLGALFVVALFIACLPAHSDATTSAPQSSRRRIGLRVFWAAVAAGCLVFVPIGSFLQWSDQAQAMVYCDGLRPALERYRQVNGHYPERLGPDLLPRPLPHALSGRKFYQAQDNGYLFSVPDRSRIFAGYEYHSARGQWDYWD
jgi:hypothetical protein